VNREQVTRNDFPSDGSGYDRASVDAHLEAVAALTAALEAQVKALEVERDALRRQLGAVEQRVEDHVHEPVQPVERDEQAAPVEPNEQAAPAEPDEPTEPAAQDELVEPPGPEERSAPGQADREQDEVSARLVATRLALEGAEPEQIREKLLASYELEDVDALIDDVIERIS
jgi:cell division septum initiation protein DivIVA